MFLEEIQQLLLLLTRGDVVEIVCCVIVTHLIMNDVYKKYGVRWYTISYCGALFITITWLLSYKIISSLLFIAALVQFIVHIHNPQTSVAVIPSMATSEQNNWIETIIALSIQAFHENISLTWIIDHEERLHEFLHAEINLQVYIVSKLSHIIFNTIDATTKTSTLWVNRHGYIIGINPYKGTTKTTPTLNDITMWSKQNGLIMIQSYAQKRMYTVVHKGIVRENLSSHHAYNTIKQILTPQEPIHTQELT